jgi:hypothetical protein
VDQARRAGVLDLFQCSEITPPDCRGSNHRPAALRQEPTTPGQSTAREPTPPMPRRCIQAPRSGKISTSVRPAGGAKGHPPIPSRLLFHAEDEAASENTTPNTKTIRCVRARLRRKPTTIPHPHLSTPDGPHAPKRKTIGSDRVAENFTQKTIKKAPRNPRRLFSERKVHAFHGLSALRNDDAKPEE